jgi:hypothetical protein
MSETGKAKDTRASRAKPRLEERVGERGWRPTLVIVTGAAASRRAHRRARRRAIAAADASPLHLQPWSKEAAA